MAWTLEGLAESLRSNPDLAAANWQAIEGLQASQRPSIPTDSQKASSGPPVGSGPVSSASPKPPKRTRRNDEEKMQRVVVKWAALSAARWPELRWLHHSPNGGARDEITGAMMKALGTKAGFPDLFLPAARLSYHGLFIEMKLPKELLRPTQNEWRRAMEGAGYSFVVCYSAEDAIETLRRYLEAL